MDSASKFSSRFSLVHPALLFTIMISLLIGAESLASVLVAPTVVFLSDKDKTGRMTIQNPTDKPKEVSIYISWGLPTSDSAGNIQVILKDSGVTDPHSAKDWVKPFPSKMILGANSSQVVRFRANPPGNLPDGEYWARIVVKAQEGEMNLPVPSSQDKITTKLNMITQTAIMLKYRTGNLVSKLELVNAEARRTDEEVVVTASFENKGNVSYVGVLRCRLMDNDGNLIAEDKLDLAVYYSLTRKVTLPLKENHAGKPLRVELAVSTSGRTDISDQDLIPGNSLERSLAVNQ
ncbi:MAG: hypothetical protein AB1690_09475 [Candidatus Zixiibacteriota bacterium]